MSKINKYLKNAIAVILVSLTGLLLPTQVFAEILPQKENIYSTFYNVQGESESIGNIVSEITDERSEYSKKFILDDGTKMIAEYEQPIHYKDGKGKWVEYNNSLVSYNAASTNDEADSGEYTNKSSDIKVILSNKAKSDNMVKVKSDKYSISWGYDEVNKSKVKIVKDNTKLGGNEKFTNLKNMTAEAKYEDVYKNVDLQYFVTSTGIKENIILKSSDVQNEFNLTYKIKNLTAKQTDDYTITLYNKDNKEEYTITAPYMTDANGKSSTQLKLELVSQKGSTLKVKLTADYWFIHSNGRSFPITIDPELTTYQTKSFLFYENVNNIVRTYGPYYTSNNSYFIAAAKSLPELKDGEKIISAKYNFGINYGDTLFTSPNDSPIIINAHKLKSSSGNQTEYESEILDYDSLTYNDNKRVSFDLTQLTNEWYNNGDYIDGLILEALDTAGSRQVTFNDAARGTNSPIFTITYKDFTGTESNLTYHTIPVGHDAQASISDYLGNLIINQSLYEGTGSRMPATITATYNSVNYNTVFGNGSPSGYGWQFSFNQYVREADSTLSAQGYTYIYTDSDGTDHYFKKSDGSEEWSDEDGLGLTLTKDSKNIYIDNGSTKQTYELTSAGGKLLSEKDEYNNTITYGYTDGNVTSITDGSGRVAVIHYKDNAQGEKRVYRIRKPDNKSITFIYTSSDKDKISSIDFGNDLTTKFEYDSSDRLKSIIQSYIYSTPTQQHKYTFTYNNGKVNQVTEYGSDDTEGKYLYFNYRNDNTTVVSDNHARSVTYTFDNSGNQISVLNANGYLESNDNSSMPISNGADSFTKNYITESTEQSAIKSGNYYYTTHGDRNGTVSKGGTCAIDTSAPSEENGRVQYFGTTSIKVNNPVSSTNSAFFTGATHQFNTTEFNGKNITFSAYVKTKNISQIYSGGAIGAILKIKSFDANGATTSEINSIGITDTQDWQRLSVMTYIPASTKYVRVYCMIRYATGTAWFDCLQLEEGVCANDFNALQNGNFESNEYWFTNENKEISAQNGTVTLDGKAAAYEDATTATEEVTDDDAEETQSATYYKTVQETEPNDSITTYDNYGNVVKTEQGFVTRTVKKTYEVESTKSSSEETTEPAEDNTTNTSGDGLQSIK